MCMHTLWVDRFFYRLLMSNMTKNTIHMKVSSNSQCSITSFMNVIIESTHNNRQRFGLNRTAKPRLNDLTVSTVRFRFGFF